MDTIEGPGCVGPRTRQHSADFRAEVIEACRQPGVSIAAVALDHRLNANMLRIWVAKAQKVDGAPTKLTVTPAEPVPITPPKPKRDILVDIQRGAAKVQVRWLVGAAPDCAALLRDVYLAIGMRPGGQPRKCWACGSSRPKAPSSGCA